MAEPAAYDVTRANKVGRMSDRGRYDYETVHAIFRACPTVHLAFIEGDAPQCVPLVAALDETEEGLFVILHGYHRARFVRLASERGVPLCVTATFTEGIVLAIAAFHHSINYRSATLHGYSDPIADHDLETKRRYSRLVVEGVLKGRWDGCRQPTDAELKSTGFVRMRVETGSAKVRSGGPKDDKDDLEDVDILDRVWSGVVPLNQQYGAAEPTGSNKIRLPPYIQQIVGKPPV